MPEPSSEARVALTVPPVRIESPDALFAPDHRIMMPLPAPLYLLSCLKLPLVDGNPTADGLVKHTAHHFQRNTIVYADGSRFQAEVSSSPPGASPPSSTSTSCSGSPPSATATGSGRMEPCPAPHTAAS